MFRTLEGETFEFETIIPVAVKRLSSRKAGLQPETSWGRLLWLPGLDRMMSGIKAVAERARKGQE